MCLIVKKGTPIKIAEEDIVCYKKLDIYKVKDGMELKSPYQYFVYKLGEEYRTSFGIEENIEIGENAWWADNEVQEFYENFPEGELMSYNKGFHSYKENKPRHWDRPNVECIIPKDSQYVEDETGLICSESIIIIKIL